VLKGKAILLAEQQFKLTALSITFFINISLGNIKRKYDPVAKRFTIIRLERVVTVLCAPADGYLEGNALLQSRYSETY